MMTDAELLEKFVRERGEEAFAELVQRHIGMVHAAALRQVGGDAHLAEDVTQVVFTALARKAEGLRGRAGLAGWLYLSTHHAAAQVVRAERRRRAREEAHAMQEQIERMDTDAAWARVRPVLDEAMRELGETEREAVLLRFFEQRAFAQVGAALNVSEDAARMRVERALEKLRGLLERHGITSTGAALSAVLTSHASVVAPAALVAEVTGAAALSGAMAGTTLLMKNLIVGVSAVAVVATGGVVYQMREAERAAGEAARAAKERDVLAARLKVAQTRADEAERRARATETRAVNEVPPAAVAGVAAARPAPGVGSISAVAFDGTTTGTTHFADTAAGRRAMIRSAVAQTFGAFFRRMGWDDRQQELFQDLWADRKEAEQEKLQRAQAEGKQVDRDLLKSVFQEASREFDARLDAAFGGGTVAQMRDYEAKGAFRHVAEETAKRLFYSDTPLAPLQADRLAEMMAMNARRPDGKLDIQAMNPEAVLAQAQALLTPAQLAAFREVEAEQRRQRELAAKAREQRAGAGPKG